MEGKLLRFINEPVEVEFAQPPVFEKSPPCPLAFIWRNERFLITDLLSQWVDNSRRGRMRSNMRPEHASRALVRGSWGVGQYYFRVRTHSGRVFDLYYDRAPKDVDHRKGAWFLDRELEP